MDPNQPYIVAGRSVPYRDDGAIVSLAEISIGVASVEIVMDEFFADSKRITFEIWEHTIHELESLSMSLRHAARSTFPQPFNVLTPDSWIGESTDLTLVTECEVGYSLQNPGAQRSTLFCSSQNWGMGDELGVKVGLALMGGYGEVVMEQSKAVEFVGWLDCHLKRFA